MTTHKVEIEKMMERICVGERVEYREGNPQDATGIVYDASIDSHKLAEVLCEMEERIEKAPIEHCGVEDCPECNKEAYKSGYLAALEDVRSSLPDDLPRGSMIGYDRLIEVLDELKKKI